MEYRINRRTGDSVSIIGMGTSSLSESEEEEAVATLRMAYEQGINHYELPQPNLVALRSLATLLPARQGALSNLFRYHLCQGKKLCLEP